MSEDELTRFEFASQSHLRKARVRDVMEGVCGPTANLTDEMVIVVSGLTKMFLSEVVDTGKLLFLLLLVHYCCFATPLYSY